MVASIWNSATESMLSFAVEIIRKSGWLGPGGGRWGWLQSRLSYLHGKDQALEQVERFWGSMLIQIVAGMAGIGLLGAIVDSEGSLLAIGSVVACIWPYANIRRLDQTVIRVKQSVLMELPEWVDRFLLYVGAGDSITAALIRCEEQQSPEDRSKGSRLSLAWSRLASDLRNNVSLSPALDRFTAACFIREASVFASTVYAHSRLGGDELSAALKELSGDVWEKRKTTVKMIGEEAAVKMSFPIVLMFLIVTMLVAAPAVMLVGYS